ncbi:MAG: hypothetical protein JEZ08_02225 [Clostridiales bacterium]|nr:hypothetical protein [Clostridiales bacterium]
MQFDRLQSKILHNGLNRLALDHEVKVQKEVIDKNNLSFEEFFNSCLLNKMRRLSYKFSLTYSFYDEVDDSMVQATTELYEHASKVLKPNRRSIQEFIDYIENELEAIQYIPGVLEKKVLKSSIMGSKYNHLLDPFNRRMHHNTLEDVVDYIINTVNYKLKKYHPEEIFELDMRFYKVVNNSLNKFGREILIRVEVFNDYISVRNCERETARKLTNFLGLSEEDIKEKSSRFMHYALWLRDKGEI